MNMARYVPRVDVWNMSPAERAGLQPGQHVMAGPRAALPAQGVWMGQTPGGTDVVAWQGNIPKGRAARAAYMAALRSYARPAQRAA